MSEIIIVRDNGTLVGSDGDHLYDGERKQIGYDELVVTTEVAGSGDAFTRTTSLPDGTVLSAMSLDFDGFCEAARPKVLAGLGDDPDDTDIQVGLEQAWEAEKTITSHSKVFIDAIVDGVPTTIEKQITYIDWSIRS